MHADNENGKLPINRHGRCVFAGTSKRSCLMLTNQPFYSPHASRPGAVIVLVAVLIVVLLGFTVLAVDVGYMYNTRAELQNAADAAALAAAAFLSSGTPQDAEQGVRDKAYQYALANKAAGKGNIIDSEADVILGRASMDYVTGKYTFAESVYPWDAVKVIVRRDSQRASGPVGLFFAGIFGKNTANISASAVAALVPRDIAMTVDLSGSMNDDSELGYYKDTTINLTQVWDDLTPEVGGPTWGNMVVWGTEEIDPDTYRPQDDPGLTYMPYRTSWSTLDVNRDGIDDFSQLPAGYSTAEKNALKSGSYDSYRSRDYYADRVAVMLRIADWNDNNNNNRIDSTEVSYRAYPYSGGSWRDWIKNYVYSTSTRMYAENSAFRYRFGLKTFINYLLENRESHAETPILAQAPCQPLEAVKDGVKICLQIMDELDSNDQMSLEIYATTPNHEHDLTEDYHDVATALDNMQAGHYDSWTCIGGGLKIAIDELETGRARGYAKKIIMLMTDGRANVDQWGNAGSQYEAAAKSYALDQARRAAALGVRIYTISVGVAADRALMQEIASITHAEEFFASSNDPDEYSAQLMEIFGELGGKRPVVLIE